MTTHTYRKLRGDESPGVDVTRMAGAKLTASDAALLRKYQDTLHLAIYWPDVEHFRACVAAYDAMIARPQQ